MKNANKILWSTASSTGLALLAWGIYTPLPNATMPVLVSALIVGLFVLEHRFSKTEIALAGSLPVVSAYLVASWRGASAKPFATWLYAESWRGLSWHRLEHLVHLDTLLFIFGLSAFAAVFTQARALESAALRLMRRGDGVHSVYGFVAVMFVAVALISGILDGVSMIGLLMATLLIIFRAARCSIADQRRVLVLATFVTTFCGAWLAFGEPPNLIMRAGVTSPQGNALLTDRFFLGYCAPLAFMALALILWQLRRVDGAVTWSSLDVLTRNQGTVLFLQAATHGTMLDEDKVAAEHLEGTLLQKVLTRLRNGQPLGAALAEAEVSREKQVEILAAFTGTDDRGEALATHYDPNETEEGRQAADRKFYLLIRPPAMQRLGSRAWALGGFVAFIGLLVAHTLNHHVPVWTAPLVGALVGYVGLVKGPMRQLVRRQALHEMEGYLFLPPLFLSISLLGDTGFFERLQPTFRELVAEHGSFLPAAVQLFVTTVLSAVLDNNVVAAAGAKFLQGLPLQDTHLFSMAQIMGYALGGCLTVIGSAQSILAYGFIRAHVDPEYTAKMWLRDVAPTGALIGILSLFYILLRS